MKTWKFEKLSKRAFDSRISSDEVKNKERWLGYFLGPALVATLYAAVGQSYLNSFYTDVLHMNAIAAGLFMTLMPVISKVLDAVTNIIMGRFVDNTKSKQGKARPWILVSGPLMAITSILLFLVPQTNTTIQAIWVTCTYNLFFCISYTMYNLSNVITLPLSTRDSKKRDTLAMAQSMGINMVPGVILSVVFPSFLLPYMGVNQGRWITVMTAVSILAVIGTLLQYYFTKERVTEEIKETEEKDTKIVSLKEQIRGCISSKYWGIAILMIFCYHTANYVNVNSLLYYANWVVGTYNDGVTLSLLNIIGQALLGPGVLIMWPLVKKLGKQKVFIIGGVIATIGGIFGVLMASSMPMALAALTIRSVGNLPSTYVLLSVLADALDHVEWKSGYRCDGFSSSVYSIIITVTTGLGIGILNLGLAATGYVPPAADGSWVAQSEAVKSFLTFGVFGAPAVASVIQVILFSMFDLEKKLPSIHNEIKERKGN